jgi:hypothetical protein
MPPKKKKGEEEEDLGAMRAARFGRVKSKCRDFRLSALQPL